jgi:predicted nucleotidyltransferase
MEKLTHPGFADFCRENNIRLALLFGSRVTGCARDESDFDLAVLLDTNYPKDVLARGNRKRTLLHNLSAYFSSSRIDLVVLNKNLI